MQAIILAGGFGTRLQTVIKHQPKVLAEVNEKPFLYWLIKHLQKKGVENFVFSLGYLHNQVELFLQKEFSTLQYKCVVEDEPLGTGGAIKKCIPKIVEENFLVVNGDTFFDFNLQNLNEFFSKTNSDCTIALTPMENFDRYGSVAIDEFNNIYQFNEKKYCKKGFISTGILILKKSTFLNSTKKLPQNFSYEKDFLEPNISKLKVTGYISNGYFVDIGIPEDYYKANNELKNIVL